MGRIRVPWTSQPPLGTALDPYWVKRGLQLVYDGRRVVYSRGSGSLQTATFTGGPKAKPSLKGIVTGFGTTSGTGTTDRIDSGTLDAPKSGMRSVVAHLYANGTGGGALGRVFQNVSGSGIANAGDEALYFGSGGSLAVTRLAPGLAGQYQTSTAFPTGRWAVFGSSNLCDYPTNTVPQLFVDGVSVAVTTNSAAGAAYTATSMNVAFGNRADGTRGFDGQIGPVLIFDGYLTPQEHARLAANPWQVFQPLARNIYSDVPVGGATYTLTADSGSFTLTGQATGLAFNRVLVADTQSYTLTGQAAGLAFNRVLTADTQSYSLTGQDAGLAFNRVLSAANGSYALAGQDATLTYTPISGATYTLVADSGSFALAGQDAVLAFNRVLIADGGSYSLAGQDASFTYTPITYPSIGRPASDTSNTGWTPSTGTDLFAMVDEVIPDAVDYISASSVGAVCNMALNQTAYPGTASQQLKFRASSSTGNSVIVRLKDGATTIRSATQALTAVDTEYTITLTSGEITAITSGSLSVELESA